jgi:hypothetical protein
MTEVSRRASFTANRRDRRGDIAAAAAIVTANAKPPAAFVEAAVARLIPADEEWPGAFEA